METGKIRKKSTTSVKNNKILELLSQMTYVCIFKKQQNSYEPFSILPISIIHHKVKTEILFKHGLQLHPELKCISWWIDGWFLILKLLIGCHTLQALQTVDLFAAMRREVPSYDLLPAMLQIIPTVLKIKDQIYYQNCQTHTE